MRDEAAGVNRIWSLAAVMLVTGAATALLQARAGAQMPDPKQMSGVPLPTSEIPPGTVTVRVVRGTLSNLVVGQDVQLVGEVTGEAKTNDAGRAEFSGLRAGTRVKAVAIVDGERLESQEFTLPASSGVRLMLVATDPEAVRKTEEDRKLAAGPARTGIVVLGEQSRFVIELGDDGLNVFNIYQIVNTARTPVQPAVPIVFPLPQDAQRTTMLEGSSDLATLAGDRVNVAGPFPPGMTLVQFAYTLPYAQASQTITQRIPAALAQLAVVVQKAGNMRLESPQVSQQRDVTAEGQIYILGQGPPLPAGTEVTFRLSGLPHRPTWPRNAALVLAALVLMSGAYAAVRRPSDPAAERKRLESERERLFQELTALEESYKAGRTASHRYASRRREIVDALEGIYATLDETAAA
jgi:hypothetical protein